MHREGFGAGFRTVAASQTVRGISAMVFLLHRERQLRRIAPRAQVFQTVLLTTLLLGFFASPPACAQVAPNEIIYTRQPVFRIPFETDGNERRLQRVELWLSEDQGATWKQGGSVAPEQHGFNFRADRDGVYWFTVRTVDVQGQSQPPTLQGARPGLKVCVDTQPPVVVLRQGVGRDGTVAIEWDIREENLDLSSFSLEYRLPGSADWVPLSVEPAINGQRYLTVDANSSAEVRLRVRDLAKNEAEGKLTLSPGGATGRSANGFSDASSNRSAGQQTVAGTRWVNSKRISLNYKIDDEGPSGTSALEIWFTRDGRNWEKYREDPDPRPPCVFEVQEEGTYGFTLVARSGVGMSDRPPRAGDPPQVWVAVDLTKPVINWLNVEVGRGPETGKVIITWKATDQNLGRDPVTLSFAKVANPKDLKGPWTTDGSWTPIVSNYENTGRYVWTMPPGTPYSFMVRIEVADKAGNVGTADYAKPVLVDLHQPRSTILNVEPGR